MNEQKQKDTKAALDKAEEDVDRGFSELSASLSAADRTPTDATRRLRGILARYHEEQIWSDKVHVMHATLLASYRKQIRSLSTYGTLAITGINVLVFLLALVVVEPWRRRKLVDKIEARYA